MSKFICFLFILTICRFNCLRFESTNNLGEIYGDRTNNNYSDDLNVNQGKHKKQLKNSYLSFNSIQSGVSDNSDALMSDNFQIVSGNEQSQMGDEDLQNIYNDRSELAGSNYLGMSEFPISSKDLSIESKSDLDYDFENEVPILAEGVSEQVNLSKLDSYKEKYDIEETENSEPTSLSALQQPFKDGFDERVDIFKEASTEFSHDKVPEALDDQVLEDDFESEFSFKTPDILEVISFDKDASHKVASPLQTEIESKVIPKNEKLVSKSLDKLDMSKEADLVLEEDDRSIFGDEATQMAKSESNLDISDEVSLKEKLVNKEEILEKELSSRLLDEEKIKLSDKLQSISPFESDKIISLSDESTYNFGINEKTANNNIYKELLADKTTESSLLHLTEGSTMGLVETPTLLSSKLSSEFTEDSSNKVLTENTDSSLIKLSDSDVNNEKIELSEIKSDLLTDDQLKVDKDKEPASKYSSFLYSDIKTPDITETVNLGDLDNKSDFTENEPQDESKFNFTNIDELPNKEYLRELPNELNVEIDESYKSDPISESQLSEELEPPIPDTYLIEERTVDDTLNRYNDYVKPEGVAVKVSPRLTGVIEKLVRKMEQNDRNNVPLPILIKKSPSIASIYNAGLESIPSKFPDTFDNLKDEQLFFENLKNSEPYDPLYSNRFEEMKSKKGKSGKTLLDEALALERKKYRKTLSSRFSKGRIGGTSTELPSLSKVSEYSDEKSTRYTSKSIPDDLYSSVDSSSSSSTSSYSQAEDKKEKYSPKFYDSNDQTNLSEVIRSMEEKSSKNLSTKQKDKSLLNLKLEEENPSVYSNRSRESLKSEETDRSQGIEKLEASEKLGAEESELEESEPEESELEESVELEQLLESEESDNSQDKTKERKDIFMENEEEFYSNNLPGSLKDQSSVDEESLTDQESLVSSREINQGDMDKNKTDKSESETLRSSKSSSSKSSSSKSSSSKSSSSKSSSSKSSSSKSSSSKSSSDIDTSSIPKRKYQGFSYTSPVNRLIGRISSIEGDKNQIRNIYPFSNKTNVEFSEKIFVDYNTHDLSKPGPSISVISRRSIVDIDDLNVCKENAKNILVNNMGIDPRVIVDLQPIKTLQKDINIRKKFIGHVYKFSQNLTTFITVYSRKKSWREVTKRKKINLLNAMAKFNKNIILIKYIINNISYFVSDEVYSYFLDVLSPGQNTNVFEACQNIKKTFNVDDNNKRDSNRRYIMNKLKTKNYLTYIDIIIKNLYEKKILPFAKVTNKNKYLKKHLKEDFNQLEKLHDEIYGKYEYESSKKSFFGKFKSAFLNIFKKKPKKTTINKQSTNLSDSVYTYDRSGESTASELEDLKKSKKTTKIKKSKKPSTLNKFKRIFTSKSDKSKRCKKTKGKSDSCNFNKSKSSKSSINLKNSSKKLIHLPYSDQTNSMSELSKNQLDEDLSPSDGIKLSDTFDYSQQSTSYSDLSIN